LTFALGFAKLSVKIPEFRVLRVLSEEEKVMRTILKFMLLLIVAVVSLPTLALADEVTDWNEHVFSALITANITGLAPSRSVAIVQSSVYDAVNGIERRYEPIHVSPAAPPGASKRAAAVQAAYASLVRLFPTQLADLDAKRAASLAGIASAEAAEHSQSIERGIEWGQHVADEIWAWRSTDGFTPTPPAFNGINMPGQWRSTPPGLLPFALIQFATMTPWVIPSPSYFPQPGPPALNSSVYTADFNEVKLLGSLNSIARTQAQTDLARFWASANGPNYFWNRVAIRLGNERHTNLSENARLLALLNVAIADAGISAWHGKKFFNFWRPITAIQLADTDGNVATIPDPGWTPLLTTPPYPDYPSGLCSTSAGGVGVLADFFGENTAFFMDSNGMPNVVRSFANFQSALNECIDARIFSGIHFRTADHDAVVLGTAVARYVVANALRPLNGQRNGQIRK
jgi:PAP2 superfamily